jgi:signal peptidase II
MMIKTVVKYVLIVVLLLAGWFSDWQSKQWAQQQLKGKGTVVFVKGFVELGFAENRGMVFGILNHGGHDVSKNILLVMRVLILIGVTVYMVVRRRERFVFLLPFILIWSGAVGNVIDNVSYGYVVDFIHIHLGTLLDWPYLFNVADAYLCVGIAILSISMLVPSRPAAKCAVSSSSAEPPAV